MNTANKLTILRVLMVPLFVVFMLAEYIPGNLIWALIVFAAASLTDYFDGKIARKRGLVTEFGKFLDPLADKILVISALVCFLELGWAKGWMVIIIIARELMISGVRLVAAGGKDKIVIAADFLGKLKTAATMTAIILILCFEIIIGFGFEIIKLAEIISLVLMSAVTLLTVISGVSYIVKNKAIFKEEK
ncbi:MAG: CDP-diacylglycerol--glycerol-3-phosphate 3-phosphatidyltransferase [Eubacterium sp.]|jgi:CDP-diacylglycerol--glycerol-3-phosphate 3-phosphatidyltransferase|nr:CDP-diacylglycerol--glycerol-3-phosphate 3-phosphatidyltransferase [Eubacterium sp.]